GRADVEALAALVSRKTRVIAFTHVSNVLGAINPVSEIAAIARSVGALSVCDGAQSAPHVTVGFDALGVDVYAASAHKMLGPMGTGVLIGRREVLESMPPYQ